jgi:cold shock CspA family protein
MATAAACGKKLAGCVKWFNMKTGFGFLSVDHSNVKVAEEQYRFLVQGEYVEFDVSNVANGQHSCQAVNVTGMFGGKLMCETRNEARQQHGGDREEGGGDDSYVPVLRRSSSTSDVQSRSSFSRSGDATRGGGGQRGGRRY